MKQKLIGGLLVAGILIAGCNNNHSSTADSTYDSTDTATEAPADPSVTEIRDSGTAPVAPADSMGAMSDARMPVSKGMAKPDPAKKGMKGKVTISPAPKSTAKMEMDNTGVYTNVEVIPSFPGGYAGMQKYFDDNLAYPADASGEGVEGVVNVTFTVDENGKLTAAKTMGDKLGYGLEEEALRVINKMPAWTPGKLKGQNVKTRYTLPVRFQLY
jgi:TonB family protein